MYIYETLADELAHSIAGGQLLPGIRIPSVREYAAQRGVSINSVKAAYRLLEDRGLIVARPQSGYYVCESLPGLLSRPPESEELMPLSGLSRLLSLILERQQQGNCTDLALACPQGGAFYPAERLQKVAVRLMRTTAGRQTTYAMPPGSALLRAQVARRGLQLGMYLSADDILITHGAMEALSLAIRASTQPGDAVAVESPTFYNLYPMLQDLGRRIVNVPTHPQQGMCLDSLESLVIRDRIAAVITIPSGHNPLGFVMPAENRRRLATLAARYEFAVVEDAMYAELQFGDRPVPNIKAFDKDGWVMVCASYTKTIAPDFRIGWLEAGRFRDVVRQMKFTSSVAESVLLSDTLGIFLQNGSYDLHLRHLRKLYDRQIDGVRACIAVGFPEGTRVSRPGAGFILWVELPDGTDTLALFHAALDENILCMPGLLCSQDRAFSNCLRLAVCFELTEEYRTAIIRLGALARMQLMSLYESI